MMLPDPDIRTIIHGMMYPKFLCLGLLLPALALAQPAPGGATQVPPDRYLLIHAGTLLAVPGTTPRSQMTVVVKNDRIAAIEPGYLTEAAGAAPGALVQVHDLSHRFVLPGLMDAHVHLQHEPGFSRRRTERGDRAPPTPAEGAVNAMARSTTFFGPKLPGSADAIPL